VSTPHEAAEGSPPIGIGPAMVLVLAAWVGLIAGWLDLGLMVVHRLIDGDFTRLGEHFVWLIPIGVAMVVMAPAAMLALVAGLRRRGLRLGVAVGLLTFIGFLDLCARLPLELWSSLLLSGGLAVQAARVAGRRHGGFLGLVRRTTPLLLGVLLAV